MPSAGPARRQAARKLQGRAVAALLVLALAASARAGTAQPKPPSAAAAYVRAAASVLTGVQAILWLHGPADGDLLAIGYADRLEVGQLTADNRWASSFRLSVPTGVTALAAADLDGSGSQDLIAGTGGAGSLIRVRSVGERPLSVPVSGYLFGAARQIVTAELDGRPPAEILATNSSGELFIFSAAAGGGYRRVWRSAPGSRTQGVAAGDFDGDGRSEVATAEPGGPVNLYRWTGSNLTSFASAFPWGQVTAMAAVSWPAQALLQQAAAEGALQAPAGLVVVTDRNLVYVYAWDGQRLAVEQLAYDPEQRFRIELGWVRAAATEPGDADRRPVLVLEGAGRSGIQIVRVERDRLVPLAQVSWPGPVPDFARLSDGRLAIIGRDGAVDVLRPERPGYVVVRVDGQQAPPAGLRLRWEGDRPLIDVEQMGRVIPVAVEYDKASGQAVLRAGTSRVRLYPGLAAAQGDRMSTPLSVSPQFDPAAGRLFVPFDAVRPLGWDVTYDATVRELTLRSPWSAGHP
ncbi:MAG: hypothetical protein AB1609_01475 [Bacillota bacterium]